MLRRLGLRTRAHNYYFFLRTPSPLFSVFRQVTQERVDAEKKALARPLDQAGEMFACLTSERLLLLLECLLQSHRFAQDFNSNMPLRTALWKAGFMRNRSKPNLLKQETTSLACALRILFRMYDLEERRDIWPRVEERILEVCGSTFDHFLTVVTRETREIWAPLVVLVLREILVLSDERFQRHAAIHYQRICECLTLSFDAPLADLSFFLAAFFSRSRGCAL